MPPLPLADPGVLTEWQKLVADNVPLNLLSLPGTHNSAASHISLPSVQCQGASILEQLKHGVRFFDIRVARPFLALCGEPSDLQVIHGNFPVKLPWPEKLHDVLNDIYAFLQQHPSETAVVSIKQEGADKWQDDEFPELIWNKFVQPAQQRWFLGTAMPQLGQARGKAVLMRRFGVKNPDLASQFGFDASWWKYNTPVDDRGAFAVQDWSEVNAPDDFKTKVQYVNDQLQRAVAYNQTAEAVSSPKLFLNYCSGSNFFNPQCWPQGVATAVAQGMNGLGSGCGIVIIDYAEVGDWELVRQIVNLNLART